LTATSNTQASGNGTTSYDRDENTVVDGTRGNLMTDVQMSSETITMPSSTTILALNDVTKHEISSILERPVNLGTFTWLSSDPILQTQLPPINYTADTVNYMQQIDFPQAIFEKSCIIVDKLKNYQYFKADVEIEIKVNAQPFFQGALLLVYNPYYDVTGRYRRVGTRFLASQTSCPHKVLNLEETNSIKLICPYANIYDLFDMSNLQNQFGTVFVYALSSLKGSEAVVSCDYTIFARFVNPEFYVPTQKAAIPSIQMKHLRQQIRTLRKAEKEDRFAESDSAPFAAMDTGETATSRPVSTIAKGVTMVTDVLSNIPLIGDVASTVGWVARAIGQYAAALGWSKPVSILQQQKCVLKPNSTMIHTEGTDDAVTLALLQDNGIDGSSFIPENRDEMSLNYILGRPNIFYSKEADSVLFSDRKLMASWEVSPFSQYQYGDGSDAETLFLGSFAYTSMLSTLWRGTIVYDILVIKTAYHNGRFVIIYFPETELADLPATLDVDECNNLINTNYNVICNLKDRQDEMSRTTYRIKVPFMSNTPWRETYRGDLEEGINGSHKVPNAATLDTKIGCMGIYALTNLNNPPTVASSVNFFISHSAGEDYQLARPTIQLSPGYVTLATDVVFAESDHGAVFIPEDENLLVPSHKTCDVTAQTTGEYFLSLRSLIKRFGFLAFLTPTDDTFVGLKQRVFTEDPQTGSRALSITVSGVAIPVKAPPTPWYMISFLYRFYQGSSQLKIIPRMPSATCDSFLKFDENTNVQEIVPLYRSIGQPIFSQMQNVSNSFEIRTPYYRGIRCDVVDSLAPPILGDVRTCIRYNNFAGYGSTTVPAPIFEAAGDDFSFFFLIGPPPMMDITNVQKLPTLPTIPENIVVSLSTLTSLVADANFYATGTGPVGLFSPPIPLGRFDILDSAQVTLPITYTDLDVQNVPLTSGYIENNGTFTLRIPGLAKPINLVATLAAWQAIPSFVIAVII